MIPLPKNISLNDEGKQITIRWRDGLESSHLAFNLRAKCPCAACVQEFTGEQLLKIEDVDRAVAALQYQKIGRYALQFDWSDGHNTGIYTYERLRAPSPHCS